MRLTICYIKNKNNFNSTLVVFIPIFIATHAITSTNIFDAKLLNFMQSNTIVLLLQCTFIKQVQEVLRTEVSSQVFYC